MFKKPRAWEPSWCDCFITKPCRNAHKRTHVPTCSCALKSHKKGSKPSEPRMKWWMSGPVDMRGPWQLFSITPRGVTIFTWTTYWGRKQPNQHFLETKIVVDFLPQIYKFWQNILIWISCVPHAWRHFITNTVSTTFWRWGQSPQNLLIISFLTTVH